MARCLLKVLLPIILLATIADVSPQSPYLKSGPIGSVDTTKSEVPAICPFRELSQCIGERFIFVPVAPLFRNFGYQSFKGGRGQFGVVSYEEGVGRVGIIEAVRPKQTHLEIKLRMVDNGQVYVGSAFIGTLHGVVPLRDIDSARVHWAGRTYFYCDDELATDPMGTGETKYIHIKQYRPVRIMDVVVSGGVGSTESPARLIIKTEDGTEGFVQVAVSGTNVSELLRRFGHFDHYFMETNPRLVYKWPDEIWSAIEDHKVAIDMTPQQVRMSWGEPATINKTVSASGHSEQWVYNSGSYVYFDNGAVTAIQVSE